MSATATSEIRGDYNDLVRRCFRHPAHAGRLPPDAVDPVHVFVREGGAGARIELSAVIEQATVRRLRYRVFGCPHLVAAAELTAEAFEGGPVDALGALPVDDLMERLGVPVEKTGRILLLEDACRALAGKCAKHLEKPARRTES